MGRPTDILKRMVPILLAFLVLAVCIALYQADTTFKRRLQNFVFDTFQQIDPREPLQGSPVLILDIDEESLAKIGQWPWPRDYLAAITQYLQDVGAAVIAYDVFFSEPDRASPSRVVERIPEDIRQRLDGLALPDNDAIFATAVARGRVVLGHFMNASDTGGETAPPPDKFSMSSSEPHASNFMLKWPNITRTIPVLEDAAAGLGSVNIVPDKDGVVRSVPLVSLVEGSGVAALALEALRVAQGQKTYQFKTVGGSGEIGAGQRLGIVKLKVGQFIIPTEKDGSLRIHYAHRGAEEVIPIWKVVTGDVDPARLQGRIVLIGASAGGLKDLRFNTLGEEVPGVFMHGQIIDQILSNAYLVRPDWAPGAETVAMIVVSLLLITVVLKFGALWSGLLGGALVMAGGGMSLYAFLELRLLFDPIFPSGAAMAVFVVCSSVRYWQTEQDQKFIRNAFKTYVSPNLVEHLARHPEVLQPGGTRREMTFLFSDLAGFTSFVEKSDPEVAVPLLNEYIENMVNIGFKHDGYLDKVVGDATVFHFNAFGKPANQPDHAQRAYECAMEMAVWSDAFSKEKQAEGIPVNETRIGVNSGLVTIGNFGGNKFFDYTAHGDAINTAARLESAGKFLGIHTSISGATVERTEGFIGRPCGTLVLKGQTVGTPVFEPMSEDRRNGPAVTQYLKAYSLMEAEDPAAEEAMEEVLLLDPDDGLAKLHLRRLRDGETGTRIVMTSK